MSNWPRRSVDPICAPASDRTRCWPNKKRWWSAWDPYPFILLNLVLSIQAAYTAPIIMMSQNRQASVDRHQATTEYQINAQAALEVKLLHQKLDELREVEFEEVKASLEQLDDLLISARERRAETASSEQPQASTHSRPVEVGRVIPR